MTSYNMRCSIFSAVILFAACFLSGATISLAEVWKCGQVYTNTNAGKSNCAEIEGSKVCGREGNKYFAPKKMSGSTEKACASTGKSRSPFVDLEHSGKLQKNEGDKPALKERTVREEKRPQTTDNPSQPMPHGLPGNDEVIKALEDISNAL